MWQGRLRDIQGKIGAAEQALLKSSEMQRSTHARFAREERKLAARYVQLEERRLLETSRVLVQAAERERQLLRSSYSEVATALTKAKEVSPSRELGLFQRKAVARLVRDRVVSQHAHLAALPDDPRKKAQEEKQRRAEAAAELQRAAERRREEQRSRWATVAGQAEAGGRQLLTWLEGGVGSSAAAVASGGAGAGGDGSTTTQSGRATESSPE